VTTPSRAACKGCQTPGGLPRRPLGLIRGRPVGRHICIDKRNTRKMIVYMALNEATEMGYVGRTHGSLEDRWEAHVSAAERGSSLPFHAAIREWGTEVWTKVILQHCSTEEELKIAEGNWIDYLCTREHNVGYNVAYARNALDTASKWVERMSSRDARNGAKSLKNPRAARPRAEMTETQLEFFRECGRRGARPKSDMSEEELARYREWGRKGAERARLKKLGK
jgi:hypothetical protein